MYSNIGKKLQAIAKICGVIGIICAILGVLVFWFDSESTGIIVIVSGIMSLIGSLPLYAFGQMTDDVHEIRNNISNKPQVSYNDLPEL